MLAPLDTFNADIVAARPMLLRYATKLCKNPDQAQDLVQETLLRALLNKQKFTPGTNLGAWLVTILRYHRLTEIRKHKREVEDPDDGLALRVAVIDDPVRKLEAREILRLVDMMPKQFQAILRLVGDGASEQEMSIELGEHPGTIKSRIHRAREMLAAAL